MVLEATDHKQGDSRSSWRWPWSSGEPNGGDVSDVDYARFQADNVALQEAITRATAAEAAPADHSLFDVRAIDQAPTEAMRDEFVQMVIAMETHINRAQATLAGLVDLLLDLSVVLGSATAGAASVRGDLQAAVGDVTQKVHDWREYVQTANDVTSVWRQQLAVIEHNLEWQRYERDTYAGAGAANQQAYIESYS